MSARSHALFQRYPLDGETTLSVGAVRTPYHVYDGHGVFIGGTADLAAVRELLRSEQVVPVCTDAGHALMGIWVFDFTDASLGAHHELQFSLFVSDREIAPVDSNRLSVLHLLVARPEVKMLCHGVWNNNPRAVAYNRELLALDARVSESRIAQEDGAVRFSIRDKASGAPVLEGCVNQAHRPSMLANLALLARLGLRRVHALAQQPWLRVPVLNPVGRLFNRNAAADSFTKSEKNVLRYFDRKRDRLAFGESRYRGLHFQPHFFQFMDGFKFVYLFPQ